MKSIKVTIFALCLVGFSNAQAFRWQGRSMSQNILDLRGLSRQTMLRDMYEFNVTKNLLASPKGQLAIAHCLGSVPDLTGALNVNINHDASQLINFVSDFKPVTTCSATTDRMSWDEGVRLIADFKIYFKFVRQLRYVDIATSRHCSIKELIWLKGRFIKMAEMADRMNAFYSTSESMLNQSACARTGKEGPVEVPPEDMVSSEK